MDVTDPLLSLILCSRNDSYAGDSLWRLQTTLCFIAEQLDKLGHARSAVEVVVADWGSEEPLREALELTAAAAARTRFVEVSPDVARIAGGDSPFPEVLANNAAIRRARGQYIGRIDQDTLVGRRFFERFFALAGGGALADGFAFVGRRAIPRSFARERPLAEVSAFVERFGALLPRDGRGRRIWYDAPTGVELMHRDLWWRCGGYDERLLYWGYMGTDLGTRVSRAHGLIDLERRVGCDFFHLNHSQLRLRVTRRRKNPRRPGERLHPNSADWGLANEDLPVRQGEAAGVDNGGRSASAEQLLLCYGPALGKEWLLQLSLTVVRTAMRPFYA